MANDLVIAYLDELSTQLASRINVGFNNESVIWFIMAWTKIAIVSNGPGYRRSASDYLDKRDLPKLAANWKRSKNAQRAVDTFLDYLTRLGDQGSVTGDQFKNADTAMMDFFVDYRLHTVGQKEDSANGEQDFIKRVRLWTALSADQMRQKVVFNMDRS